MLTISACPWLQASELEVIDFTLIPQNPEETLRSKVFADLWLKGHFVTAGQKFGGDFLVYPGKGG